MWVKICGIRDEVTAAAVAGLRPDAVGLNFHAPSQRAVTATIAARIVAALPADVEPVGIFVNASGEEIRTTANECGLRTIQLHGDESPELMAELSEFRLLRAFRVGGEGLLSIHRDLEAILEAGVALAGCLVEARVAGEYGGTGTLAPWELLEGWSEDWPPLILAGGLTPQNVEAGIRATGSWGVDVASGVESRPGEKDLGLVRAFIENARGAS